MWHLTDEKPNPPTEPGEVCRLVGDCRSILLYYEYLGPAFVETEIAGTRAMVRTPGGREYDVPLALLTTSEPLPYCAQHAYVTRRLEDVYVRRTQPATTARGGRKRRETKLERDGRLARWEQMI